MAIILFVYCKFLCFTVIILAELYFSVNFTEDGKNGVINH